MRAIFDTVDDATNAISDIIGAGMVPAAMELMDQGIVAAVEEAYHFGFPLDAGAIVVIEIDGPAAGLDEQQRRIVEFCHKWRAREVLQATTAKERELLWKCRKMSVGAVGRLSPSYCIQDGVVPHAAAAYFATHHGDFGQHQVRIVNVSCGRRQRSPDPLVRRTGQGRGRTGLGRGKRTAGRVRCLRRRVTAEHGSGSRSWPS